MSSLTNSDVIPRQVKCECGCCAIETVMGFKCAQCGKEYDIGGVVIHDDIQHQKHYTQYAIQPMEFIGKNELNFLQGNIIKYVCRYKAKNRLEDLKKAQHYLEKLVEFTEKGAITL